MIRIQLICCVEGKLITRIKLKNKREVIPSSMFLLVEGIELGVKFVSCFFFYWLPKQVKRLLISVRFD